MGSAMWAAMAAAAMALAVGCSPRESVADAAAPEAAPPAGEPAATDRSGDWVGKTAAGFVLPDSSGKPVDVGKALGAAPVVLVFYRGVW